MILLNTKIVIFDGFTTVKFQNAEIVNLKNTK